jgi:hypothetical protein
MAATATPGKPFALPSYTTNYGAPFLPNAFATGGRGRVFWVGNASGLPSGNGSSPDYPFSTVAKALAKCVSGRGDIVYVLQGHTESFTSATTWSELVASTKIIGLGTGTERPTFTLAAAGAVITVTKANVMIRNCRFLAAGPAGTTAITVANPLAITAAGFQLIDNDIECGIDADQLATNCITASAAADDMTISGNNIHGAASSVITTILVTTGAVDRLKIINNYMRADAGASGFLLDLSNAAILENDIIGNTFANITASSTAVIKPHATSTGMVLSNIFMTQDAGTAPASSGFTTFTTTYQFAQNFCITTTAKSAILCPGVDS